jgi:hypothetical protein
MLLIRILHLLLLPHTNVKISNYDFLCFLCSRDVMKGLFVPILGTDTVVVAAGALGALVVSQNQDCVLMRRKLWLCSDWEHWTHLPRIEGWKAFSSKHCVPPASDE